jgi:hypothetical protein
MTTSRLLLLVGVVLILLLAGLSGGFVWWYLYGANEVEAADLVPANTVLFATIPNGVSIATGYETSQLKKLADSPDCKPLLDSIVGLIGQKNFNVAQTFLPDFSGQSFIAITHIDYDKPAEIGFVAAMKPKPGMGDFGTFLDKIKSTWPDLVKQGTTGKDTIDGVPYDWFQQRGAPEKICVAQVGGWIVTTWGEASLQDWVERFQKKSTTSSLAHDLGYRKSTMRVGDDPMALVYINYHDVMEDLQKRLAKTNPATSQYIAKKLDALGGAALAVRFENGEIVDRFSLLMPRPAQEDRGIAVDPCKFETLKFTGPDTRLYWASSINWKQYYKNLKEQARSTSTMTPGQNSMNPAINVVLNYLHDWAAGTTLDVQQNVVDALGPEVSVQAEWTPESLYPEVGLFVKLDKPDDFKPTIAAVIDSLRKACATTAVINEINSNGHNFAVLHFIQPTPISPTITEDGPYLGVFLTKNQAVRSFQRDETIGLTHNADFNSQVGDKRANASQILFLDSPRLLDRAYRTALPYLSIAGMFNKNLGSMLKGHDLPPDLTWLAPIGTWSLIITPDEEGIQGYSVSGIGNQGIILAGALGGVAGFMQASGMLPKPPAALGATPVAAVPPAAPPPMVQQNTPPTTNVTLLPAAPMGDHSSTPDTPGAPAGATIYIDSDSRILFDNTPVSQEQIADFLKSKKSENPSLTLAVKVDRDSSPDVLSTVMDAGASAGFGVLPYTYTAHANSLLLPTNTNSVAPPSATNAASGSQPSVNAAASSTPLLPSLPIGEVRPPQTPATNADLNATPPNPAPAQTQ